jgi:hypothetical protein
MEQNPLLSYLNTMKTQQQPVNTGESTGVSDDIPAMLSEGEFVVNAEQVSKLGGGATDPGLNFLEEIFGLIDAMDRETAASFAENILITGELLLEEQPRIEKE